jgi:hypothetical protein
MQKPLAAQEGKLPSGFEAALRYNHSRRWTTVVCAPDTDWRRVPPTKGAPVGVAASGSRVGTIVSGTDRCTRADMLKFLMATTCAVLQNAAV